MPIQVSTPPGRAINISKDIWVDPSIRRDGELFGEDHINRVLSTARDNLIGFWPIIDPRGATVARDLSPQGNPGVHTAVSLGQRGIGDGFGSGLFDGTTSFCNVYSAGLAAAFSGQEGTLAIWAKVSGAGVWTDGVTRTPAILQADANNKIRFRKPSNNTLEISRFAGGTEKTVSITISVTTWFHVALVWSRSAGASGQVIGYLNGAQQGATLTGIGDFAGALAATTTTLGADTTGPLRPWDGHEAHGALWTTPLSAAQIAALAVV